MSGDSAVATKEIVVITGGGRGIGAASARLLAARGYQVCVNFRTNEAAVASLVDALIGDGANAIAVKADVSVEDDVVRLFDTVDNELGKVTALVNNAGIVMPQIRLEDMSAARVNRLLTTNVTGSILCCREAVRRMSIKHGGGGGSIVNLSSIAALTGSPGEYIDYAASKGAIDTLTRGLALELAGEGIRVNCVRPGFIYTEMHADGGEPNRVDCLADTIPMKRSGTPDEVAEAIAWLLSGAASYVTGSFIDAGGGRR